MRSGSKEELAFQEGFPFGRAQREGHSIVKTIRCLQRTQHQHAMLIDHKIESKVTHNILDHQIENTITTLLPF